MSATVLPLPKKETLDRASLLGALLTVILWASSFAAIRVGLESYAPESLALLRYLSASFVLGIFAIWKGIPLLPEKEDIPGIALMGFLGFSLYNVALNAGEVGISAGVASFIVASAPIYMALLALVRYGERLNKWGWGGIVLSFMGVGVISLAGKDGLKLEPRALLVLLAAMLQASYSVGQRPYLKKYGALRFIIYAIWMGTLFLLVFTPKLIHDARSGTTESTMSIIYLGIFPGALAYASWSFVLSRLPAAIAGSFLYLVPAFAVLIAWLWLGEVPPTIAIFGGLLIIAGVITVNVRGR